MRGAEVGCWELKDFGRLDDAVNPAALLFADPHAAHERSYRGSRHVSQRRQTLAA